MAEARGIAHLTRDTISKLVGILTDPSLARSTQLDQAQSTLDRAIRDAESPAAAARARVHGVLDEALAAASAASRAGMSRAEAEARVRSRLVEELGEISGITVEGRY